LFDEKIKYEDAVAFFRYSVISPMLHAPKGKIDATAKKLANQKFHDQVNQKMVSFCYRTIYRYYMNYKKDGFEGLKPKVYKNRGTHPSIPDQVIREILNLKEELPSRSAQKIITMLELSKKIEADSLHRRTVNRILKNYGYTTKQLKKKNRVFKKHEKDKINSMWQSDIMSAFYLPDQNNQKRLAYLIGFLDDHSRRLVHGQFYFDATLTRLEDCLRKAVIKFGAPDTLYIDNGKVYISDNFKLICARLGIKLLYAKPYHAAGKGKIEKFWQFVQTSFISEIKNNHLDNIMELNDLFSGWLKKEYHDKVHSSLGATPIQRWNDSLNKGASLRYFSPVQIDKAFLHYAERTVNKYGTISFEGNSYEVDGNLINKKIGLRFNPFHLEEVHIYHQDKYYGLARVIDLDQQKHRDVKKIEEDPEVDSKISQQYFDNIKNNYQQYLKKQLNRELASDLDNIKNDSQILSEDNEKNDKDIYCAPDEKTMVIKRNEFVEIVTDKLPVDHLSFNEKGKLYQLWDTFKEFNREILLDILEDIKNKTPDFNQNFLFYLTQIKDLYLKKSKEMNI
jgi:transposase InsO family protein